jgi:hypothetical protein
MGKDFNLLFFYKNGKKVKHLIDSGEKSPFLSFASQTLISEEY